MFIAVPTGIKIFNWIATMWGGSIKFTTAMLFAIGFIAMFIIGGLSGVMHAVAPSDTQQSDTYFIVAHLHYVLFGGSILGLFAGIYYWWPKITGRLMNEVLGKVQFWLFFIGMNITFFPMHFLGLQGMPRRIHTFDSSMGWDLWNIVATAGAFFMAASILIFIHNAVRSLKKGERAPNDPWDGRTLEWSIPSPPPIYNFAEIPQVHGIDPHWSNKYGDDDHSAPVPVAGGAQEEAAPGHEHSDAHGDSGHGIHLPGLSYYPVMLAFGLAIAGYGLVFHQTLTWALAIVGLGIGIVAAYLWSFEPADEEHEPDD
jgi:cytochrome c oxidase subunit 1